MEIIKFCNKYFSKYKLYLVTYILVTLSISGISIYATYLTGSFIDKLIARKSLEFVYHFCLILAGITLIRLLFGYISSIMYMKMQMKVGYELNREIIFHIQDVSLTFINKSDTAYLNQIINNDANSLVIFYITTIQNVFVNVVTLIITLYICFKINYLISIMSIVFIGLYVILYKLSKGKLYNISMLFKESQGDYFSSLLEQLLHIKFIKMHSFQNEFRQRVNTSFKDLFANAIKNQKISYLFSSIDNTISMAAQILLFLIGSIQIIQGNFTIGMFTIFSNYFNMMLGSARYFFNLGKTYQENLVSYNRLINLINQPKEKEGSNIVNDISSIETKNLNLFFNDKVILNNVNVTFEMGKIYGVVGANGSGKSTLTNLIMGLYINEKEGNIYFDNNDISQLNLYHLRKELIGISEQEPMLINESIKYNLLNPDIDTELINKYIDILGLDEYIKRQPMGLNTIIYEKNSNISGGEKQKISILRVLLKDPKIMIFDEPTSALDLNSSQKFINYLSSIKDNKIILLITHDKDIQSLCDVIYNLSA
jgi:ATP-binding cassette subfamily C protein